jgi:hypothetical protein
VRTARDAQYIGIKFHGCNPNCLEEGGWDFLLVPMRLAMQNPNRILQHGRIAPRKRAEKQSASVFEQVCAQGFPRKKKGKK